MAEVFSSPYQTNSPLGAALKNLSTTLGKKSSEASDIANLEYALGQKQKRENTAALGDALRALGTAQFNRNAAIDNAVRGGVNPDTLGGYERYYNANTYGAGDQRTSNAVVGSGMPFTSSAQGAREGEAAATGRTKLQIAEQARQFDQTPYVINTPQGPTVATRATSIGQPAVEEIGKVKGAVARNAYNAPGGLAAADDATQAFIGVTGKGQETPRNYVAGGVNYITNDGLTDARTGQPLPQGGYIANAQGPAKDVGITTGVQTDLQKADIEGQKLKGLIGYTRNLAKADPNNFGVSGFVKGVVQDVNAVAGNVAQGLGYPGLQDAAAAVRSKALASGVDPGLLSGVFDPKLPALHSASDLLVFQAASALAGQSGRSVTDRDVKMFRNIVGDPQEWAGNQQKYLSKLDTIEQILDMNQNIVGANLSRANPGARPAAPGVASSPTSPAPGAPSVQPDMSQARQAPDGNFYVPDPARPGKFLQVQP